MERLSPSVLNNSRRLRREQTEVEKRLWARLRARQLCGAKFRRQHPIGRFIADFCCLEGRLVVELDGGQHAVQAEADRRRSLFLERLGYRVVRFWDNEVMEDIEAVLQRIAEILGDPHPIPLLYETVSQCHSEASAEESRCCNLLLLRDSSRSLP